MKKQKIIVFCVKCNDMIQRIIKQTLFTLSGIFRHIGSKMNKKIIYIIIAIIIIMGGTLFDVMFIRTYTFYEYMFICFWEFIIFGLGLFVGYKITNP